MSCGTSRPLRAFSSAIARRLAIAHVELAALPIARVGILRRAVDRERDLVDARMHQAPRLLFVQREPVRARVEVDVRKLRLDVLAHLDRALVEERFAVVEEVDAYQRRSGFVDDAREHVPVEHAGLTRARDAGFRGAARLEARDVAGRRALDVQPAGQRRNIEIAHGRRLVWRQRQLQRAVAAERRAPGIEVFAQLARDRPTPDLGERRRAKVAEHPLGVRIGAAADDAAVAEHDGNRPGPAAGEAGGEVVQRHHRGRALG